jgi:hypothetical protein
MSAQPTSRIRLVGILVAAVAIMTSGCNRKNLTSIEGTVFRNDGTPLPGARLVLRSKQSGKTIYGYTNDSGKVRLQIPEEEPLGAPRDYDVMIVEETGNPDNRRPETIAAKYQDATKSGLKLTVQPDGKNQFEFKLDPPR